MIRIIGWIGAICFGLSVLPEAVLTVERGEANAYSPIFLALWLIGELCSLAYACAARPIKPFIPIIANYIFNLICLIIILIYYIRDYGV